MDIRTAHPKADSNLLRYLPRLPKHKQKTMKLLFLISEIKHKLLTCSGAHRASLSGPVSSCPHLFLHPELITGH